jgi:uncharacterized membrane protein YuzA (DUF378 family)
VGSQRRKGALVDGRARAPERVDEMRNPYDLIGRIGLVLAVVGALNWLLVGLFEWNLVKWIFTDSATQTVGSVGERIVYIVIGVGGALAIPMIAATLSRGRRTGRDYGYGDARTSGSDAYRTGGSASEIGARSREEADEERRRAA